MRKRMALGIVVALLAVPGWADEIEDVVEGALEAYRAGDIATAREELDFALKLLDEAKAAGLVVFLPEPLPGWTRQIEDSASVPGPFAMLGGGSVASATYLRGTETFSIAIIANAPLVSGMAAMIAGMSSLSGARTVRIQRVQFSVADGEIQGVVGGGVLVQASGDAAVEDKQAHLEAMDFGALEDF